MDNIELLEARIDELKTKNSLLELVENFKVNKDKLKDNLLPENIEYLENQLNSLELNKAFFLKESMNAEKARDRAIARDNLKSVIGFDLGVKFAISLFVYGKEEVLSEESVESN